MLEDPYVDRAVFDFTVSLQCQVSYPHNPQLVIASSSPHPHLVVPRARGAAPRRARA